MQPAEAQPTIENPSAPPAGVPGLEWVQSFRGLPNAHDTAWSADGAFLATTGSDGEVTVWSASDGHRRRLRGHKESKGVMSLAWFPGQPVLATGSDDGTVRLWDLVANTSRVFCTLENGIWGVAWSPNGDRLALGDYKGGVGTGTLRKVLCYGVLRYMKMSFISHAGHPMDSYWSPAAVT